MSAHKARIQYDEGDVYDGQWSKDGKRHGQGVLVLRDSSSYHGDFVNGFYQGYGVQSYPDGSEYAGGFNTGKWSGYGVYRNKEGMVYEGQFKDGQCNGLGMVTFPDGTHGNPRCEGVYRGEVCEKRCDAADAVKKAREAQTSARTIAIAAQLSTK